MTRPKRRRQRRGRQPRSQKVILVLAGPNGAGKSTFYDVFVRTLGYELVSADPIARELNPGDPAKAAYVAAERAATRRRELVARGRSFCMETVFSDPAGDKVRFLQAARALGYFVCLVYIGLESSELCVARVVERVAAGGHDVPDDKVRGRYPRSLKNLADALRFVDRAYLYDNSSVDRPYRHIATYTRGTLQSAAADLPNWFAALGPMAVKRPRR